MNSFRIHVCEKETVMFDKKLEGADGIYYELKFEIPNMSHDAVKLLIHFSQVAADNTTHELDTQFIYLSDHRSKAKMNNIPWTVSLIEIDEERRQGIILLEKE